jgi:hypothetical protein
VSEALVAMPGVSQVPMEVREMALSGFHWGLAAHQAVVPPSRVAPWIAEGLGWQTGAVRGLGLRVFSEPEGTADYQPALIGQVRVKRRRKADVSHSAALRRARAGGAARRAGRWR